MPWVTTAATGDQRGWNPSVPTPARWSLQPAIAISTLILPTAAGERARRWAKMLDEGVCPSLAALARAEGISRVGDVEGIQVMVLSALAILRGCGPVGPKACSGERSHGQDHPQ